MCAPPGNTLQSELMRAHPLSVLDLMRFTDHAEGPRWAPATLLLKETWCLVSQVWSKIREHENLADFCI